MSIDARVRAYWREEFSLIALLLLFFIAIVAFGYSLPFDARLFPLIIGCAGIVLTLAVALDQVRRHRAGNAEVVVDGNDPAARASWARYATALLSAPAFGLLFAAMLLIPTLMGYANRRRLLVTAVITVAVLAVIAPYLLNVELPQGVVGDWLIDKLALRAG
jgi:hypothetical protein